MRSIHLHHPHEDRPMRIQLEISLPSVSRRGWRVLSVLLVTGSLLAFPLLALAGSSFTDVPASNPFRNDIAAIANVGVTTGCGGTNYCPKDNVTREQMAAFMNRLGALQDGKTPVVNADKVDGFQGSDLALGTATIPSGMTVTGEGVFDSAIIADNADHVFNVELPARAPVALTGTKVNFAADAYAATIDDDPTCTGSFSSPTAPAGKVCIYMAGNIRIDTASGEQASALTDRNFHIYLRANGSAGDDMYMYYTWAYRAP